MVRAPDFPNGKSNLIVCLSPHTLIAVWPVTSWALYLDGQPSELSHLHLSSSSGTPRTKVRYTILHRTGHQTSSPHTSQSPNQDQLNHLPPPKITQTTPNLTNKPKTKNQKPKNGNQQRSRQRRNPIPLVRAHRQPNVFFSTIPLLLLHHQKQHKGKPRLLGNQGPNPQQHKPHDGGRCLDWS